VGFVLCFFVFVGGGLVDVFAGRFLG